MSPLKLKLSADYAKDKNELLYTGAILVVEDIEFNTETQELDVIMRLPTMKDL